MAYVRRKVEDFVSVMDKELYDNLQDGIDENKEEIAKLSENSINTVLEATVEE